MRAIEGLIHPGAGTPLWNALAAELASELQTYGHKARLARVRGSLVEN